MSKALLKDININKGNEGGKEMKMLQGNNQSAKILGQI